MFYNFVFEFLSMSYIFRFGILLTVIDKLNESRFFRDLYFEYKFVLHRRCPRGCRRVCFKKKNSVCVNTAVFGKAGLEVEANCKINCATAVIIAANFLYFLSQFKRKFKKVTDG